MKGACAGRPELAREERREDWRWERSMAGGGAGRERGKRGEDGAAKGADLSTASSGGRFNKVFIDINGSRELEAVARATLLVIEVR